MRLTGPQGQRRFDDALLAGLRARTSLVELIGGYVPLKRAGREHEGLCPFHVEKTPSFKVVEAKAFAHCFGCGWHGDAIDFVLALHGGTFAEAVEDLAARAGLMPGRGAGHRPIRPPVPRPDAAAIQAEREAFRATARRMWSAARALPGTGSDVYLRGRGIADPDRPTLRHHASLKHPFTGLFFPVLLAAIQDRAGRIVAAHRTFLRPDGSAKAAVAKAKLAVGEYAGCAIRLGPAAPVLGICEGIETGLSVQQLYGGSVWCAVSSGNLQNIVLPDVTAQAVIYADNGAAGHRCAEQAAESFHAQGRAVRLVYPVAPFGDFNDIVQHQQRVSAA